MTISAKVIAKSRSPFHDTHGVKDITTFLLRYPRFIHSEVMTHRLFSRNASSSRAIPVERLIQDVLDDTAMPIHWGKNQRGMQAFEENDAGVIVGHMDMDGGDDRRFYDTPQEAWLSSRNRAVEMARGFSKAGYHKQLVNRLLEPYAHINVVVTATGYDNFYWLRRHADAQPEIKALADAMYEAEREAEAKVLGLHEWHAPFVTEEDFQRGYGWEDLLKVSTSRCARTSYMTHDNRVPDFEEDLALYDRLVGSEPLHASPTEHQARIDVPVHGTYGQIVWPKAHLGGNLGEGYIQFRKTLPGENHINYEVA